MSMNVKWRVDKHQSGIKLLCHQPPQLHMNPDRVQEVINFKTISLFHSFFCRHIVIFLKDGNQERT